MISLKLPLENAVVALRDVVVDLPLVGARVVDALTLEMLISDHQGANHAVVDLNSYIIGHARPGLYYGQLELSIFANLLNVYIHVIECGGPMNNRSFIYCCDDTGDGYWGANAYRVRPLPHFYLIHFYDEHNGGGHFEACLPTNPDYFTGPASVFPLPSGIVGNVVTTLLPQLAALSRDHCVRNETRGRLRISRRFTNEIERDAADSMLTMPIMAVTLTAVSLGMTITTTLKMATTTTIRWLNYRSTLIDQTGLMIRHLSFRDILHGLIFELKWLTANIVAHQLCNIST